MVLDIQKVYDGLINNREYGWVSCFDDFLDSDKFKVMQYSSKRKQIKVLDMIQNHVETYSNKVFQMPQDDEVKA